MLICFSAGALTMKSPMDVATTDAYKKIQRYLKEDFSLSTWMTDMWPLIHNLCLKDFIIPGTHDSGTATMSTANAIISSDGRAPGIAKLAPSKIVRWCKTQNYTIAEQLQLGIRFFDFRVSIEPDGELYLSHGLRGEKLSMVLTEMRRFCKTHPHEIIMVKIKGFPDHKCKSQNQNKIMADFIYKYLGDFFVTRKSLLTPLASTKLSQIVETGKNAIVIYDTRIKKGESAKLIRQTLNDNDWMFDSEGLLVSYWANSDSAPKLWNFAVQSIKNAPKDRLFSLNWTLTGNARYIITHPRGGIDTLTEKINPGNEKNYDKNYVLSALVAEQNELGYRFNIVSQDFMNRDKSRYLIKQNRESLRKKNKKINR